MQWERNTDSAKQRNVQRYLRAKSDVESGNYQTANRDNVSGSSDSQYQKAKTANEVLKAQIGKIELQILKGEMIDRRKANANIFKMARAERDAWLNWPSRISAQVSAELSIDEQAFHVALEEQIRNHLIRLVSQ